MSDTASWAVTVERNGESLVTLSSNGLGGKPEFSDDEAWAIRTAGDHLLAFIGRRPNPNDDQPFIVGEISKNWINGFVADGSGRLLSQLFEHMINVNRGRGYRLHSFQLHRESPTDEYINETIIAVFERVAS